jgi:hypothetical protein
MAAIRSYSQYLAFALTAILVILFCRKDLALLRTAQAAPSRPPVPAEIERLAKFYAGTWDYTETYEKSPSSPDARKNPGIYTSELGPGANSIVNKFHSRGPVGDFEGLLVMTWDSKESAYKAYVFGSDFPGAIVETGHFEGDTLVFRGEFSMGQTKVAVRNTNRLDADGKMISDEFASANGAPESRVVQVIATRRP